MLGKYFVSANVFLLIRLYGVICKQEVKLKIDNIFQTLNTFCSK